MNEEQNINQLPKNWKWVKLKEIVSVLGDGLHGTPVYSETGEYFFINGNNLSNEKIIIKENTKRVAITEYEKYKKQLTDKTILVSINGTIGNVAFYNNEKVLLGKSACYFNIIDNVDKHYIGLLLQGRKFLKYANNSATGSTIKNVSLKSMREFVLPLPPKETQQQIVSKIDELSSEVDKGIEELKTVQQQLKVYRQAVLKWAFEGKLTEEWRKQQNSLDDAEDILKQIQDLKGKKSKSLAPLNEEEIAELFELPKSWKWVKNEDYLFEVKDGTHDTPTYIANGIPFITQKNIREDGLKLSNVQFISKEDHKKFYQRSNVAKGDILISMIGHNRGMTALVETDEVFSIKNVGLFKFIPSLQSNKFSFYYYQSQVGRNIVLKKSKGGAQPFIGLTELRNWAVVVCSLEEQQQIVHEIESRLSVCDKIEETITNSLKGAEALRQSILKKAFEGKLV